MREHADHHDAELLLKLYELRREEKLRRARDWFTREFHAESVDEYYRRYPAESQGDEYCRMVLSYWDMAASIVNRGLIQEELFFENSSECWVAWQKIRHLVPEARAKAKNPHLFSNLETLVEKYEKWMTKRAPEALTAMKERLKQMTTAKASATEK